MNFYLWVSLAVFALAACDLKLHGVVGRPLGGPAPLGAMTPNIFGWASLGESRSLWVWSPRHISTFPIRNDLEGFPTARTNSVRFLVLLLPFNFQLSTVNLLCP